MSQILQISSAVDRMGASPENARVNDDADDKLSCLSPKVKYNEELNGYHFHFFNEAFICREELPQGSETFQQVLEEITTKLDTADISDKAPPLRESNNRRKSVAITCMLRKVENNTKRRRVSWGKPSQTFSESVSNCSTSFFRSSSSSSPPFCRPRVCSDGAVVRRKSLKGRR